MRRMPRARKRRATRSIPVDRAKRRELARQELARDYIHVAAQRSLRRAERREGRARDRRRDRAGELGYEGEA
jgi:hypothetical protein